MLVIPVLQLSHHADVLGGQLLDLLLLLVMLSSMSLFSQSQVVLESVHLLHLPAFFLFVSPKQSLVRSFEMSHLVCQELDLVLLLCVLGEVLLEFPFIFIEFFSWNLLVCGRVGL